MLKIAICDDDKIVCSELEKILDELKYELKIDLEIEVFYDEKGLERRINKTQDFDLIFLDIELTEKLGSEVGRFIREDIQWQVDIIYISNKSQYAISLFKTRPFDFLIKPLTYDKIKGPMKCFLKTYQKEKTVFEYKMGTSFFKEKLENIYFFESYDKIIKMHCADGEKLFYGKLIDIVERLTDDFIVIHQSYIINYRKVKVMNYDSVELINGIELPISQSRRSEIRKAEMNKLVKNYDK